MASAFDAHAIDRIARNLREPGWLTDLRRAALRAHGELPWPHPSDDIWRRTDVSLLDPGRGFSPADPGLLQGLKVTDAGLDMLTRPLGDESLAVRANGIWLVPPQAAGVDIQDLAAVVQTAPGPVRALLEADGMTDAERKLSTLNAAFHHDDLVVRVAPNTAVDRPVRLIRAAAVRGGQAVFPMTLITVGAGASLTLIEESLSVPAPGGDGTGHLINSRIELTLEPNASVRYVRLQRWDAGAREFLLQRATLGAGASLSMANITLGAALSKAHVVTRLAGSGASTRLYGFVFGRGTQHVDQHTLQDHQAPNTTSDLQYRAALQDESRMVYTGLIRIAQQAARTNAYQSNHNLLLSRKARAETIPMLEILADDVQCKHGASVGPVDEEQAFYLMSRGIPHDAAQRLLVMGFIDPIIQQIPFEPLQERLRQEIEGGLRQES
jgi:Fe-S cluster assembly protein SufD